MTRDPIKLIAPTAEKRRVIMKLKIVHGRPQQNKVWVFLANRGGFGPKRAHFPEVPETPFHPVNGMANLHKGDVRVQTIEGSTAPGAGRIHETG